MKQELLTLPEHLSSPHNPYIEEEQKTQWPKEKVPKDKQRSTKHSCKTKNRVTRTPLITRGELSLDNYKPKNILLNV
jgi:hypothetical protein